MRILHVSPLYEPSPGIVQQVSDEQKAADELGILWHARIFTGAYLDEKFKDIVVGPDFLEKPVPRENGILAHIRSKTKHRRELYRWLLKVADGYDLILLRHTYADYLRAKGVRDIRSLGTKVGTVHHTLEGPELGGAKGLLNKLRQHAEIFLGSRNIREADLIVGVTNEVAVYEKERSDSNAPQFIYPNGIATNRAAYTGDYRGETPTMLFVASRFEPWQGLDLLLADIATSKKNFRLHIVGEVDESLRSQASQDSRIRVHGLLNAVEIEALMAESWVGLSPLALYRKDMLEACPLKVRQYLAAGLPVYGSYDDVFPAAFPFFQTGGPRVDPILDYAEKCRHTQRVTVQQAAFGHIDKAMILERFVEQLSQHMT